MSSRHSVLCLLVLSMGAPGMSLQVKNDDSACLCLPWQQTYKQKLVECGAANELTTGNETNPKSQDPWACPAFYELIKEPICMNVHYGMKIGETAQQWCYVSAQCAGAHPVNQHVSWKQCDQDKGDVLAISKTVQQLISMVDSNDAMLPSALQAAYPVGAGDWKTVKAGFDNSTTFSAESFPLPAENRQLMEFMMSTGWPLVWTSDGGLPMGVLAGNEIYEITENQEFTIFKMTTGKSMFWKPSWMTKVRVYKHN